MVTVNVGDTPRDKYFIKDDSQSAKMTSSEWYRFLVSAQDRLNRLIQNLDSELVYLLFSPFYPTDSRTPLDAMGINGQPLTNLTSFINGFLAYSDVHGRTFRLDPVFVLDKEHKKTHLKGFTVTVRATTDADMFPVFPD